ncbi:hypothetical protein, partial [Hungatella effluvii]|uniref:hypothetical protein n=1 Tax=Hungatella effluvii TaxID=1096246 RepID=UPI002A82ADBE
ACGWSPVGWYSECNLNSIFAFSFLGDHLKSSPIRQKFVKEDRFELPNRRTFAILRMKVTKMLFS